MKTFSVTQGSDQWLALRRGKVTASEADKIVTPLFKARTGEGVKTYLCQKIAEKMLGFFEESGSSFHMQNGSILEGYAIPELAFEYDWKVERVGFVSNDEETAGYSPDALIGDDGLLELKAPSIPVHLKYLMDGVCPDEYLPQVHFGMFITGRKYCKFVSYSRHLPKLIVEVPRDEEIQAKISQAFDAFMIRFNEALSKIKTMRDAENQFRAAVHSNGAQ